MLAITLTTVHILAFAALASGEQPKTEVCKVKCGTTDIKCKDIKDFIYTRPIGGIGGLAGNLNIPNTVQKISYNSAEKNLTVVYNSADTTANASKLFHLTKEEEMQLIDRINDIICNAPRTLSKGNDVVVYTLTYNTQDNNEPLKLTKVADHQILFTICEITKRNDKCQ